MLIAFDLEDSVSFEFAGPYKYRTSVLVSSLRKLQEDSHDENVVTMAGARRDIEKLQIECERFEQNCATLQRELVSVSSWICAPKPPPCSHMFH